MNLKFFIEFSIIAIIYVLQVSSSDNNEPMVAFTCRTKRPAVYKLDGKWTKDREVGCLRDPIEILRFCKKSFPKLAISNVVESNEMTEIVVWCKNNKKRCLRDRKIRPFRCLVGPFQSDALLVPDKCSFDHEHNASICANSTVWKTIASKRCLQREMELHDHSILLPCAVDAFNGVEFVCCPNVPRKIISEEANEIKLNDNLNDVLFKETDVNIKDLNTKAIKSKIDKTDMFHKYLNSNSLTNELRNEHEYFVEAMHSMEKQQHEKVTEMMKQWSAERQRIQDIRKTQGEDEADKLNAEITKKFQTTYSNLEKEFSKEKAEFLNKHESRVEKKLDNKKEEAMKLVLSFIQRGEILDFNGVKRAIKKYIRTEMKDQQHYINRWLHLQSSDEEASKRVLERYLDKIQMSNERIEQSRAIVENHLDNKHKSEFKNYVKTFIDEFIDIIEGTEWMLEATASPKTTTSIPSTTETPLDMQLKNDIDDVDDDDVEWEEDEDWDENDWEEDEDYDDDDDDEDDENEIIDNTVDDDIDYEEDDDEDEEEFYDADNDDDDDDDDDDSNDIFNNQAPYKNDIIDDIEDKKIMENTLPFEEKKLPSFAQHSKISASHYSRNNEFKPKIVRASSHNTWVITIVALSGAAMIGIIIVASVMKRKRQLRKQQISRVEAEPVMDVEKRHLTAMQSNGYENPTYKYLETGNN